MTGNHETVRPRGKPAGPGYAEMIEALRSFLDDLAAAATDQQASEALAADLRGWSARLVPLAVTENDQLFAKQRTFPGRGQTMAPAVFYEHRDDHRILGQVTFGRYYLGGNGAAHGGAIPLAFDEVMGQLASSGDRRPARTAFLNVDFRSITPIAKPLVLSAWFEREDGRKRFLRGELRDGDILCAEAHGLFVELKPGQP